MKNTKFEYHSLIQLYVWTCWSCSRRIVYVFVENEIHLGIRDGYDFYRR